MEAGRVTVGGRLARELGVRIDPGSASVAVDGRPVRPDLLHYIVLYKPRGVLCTSRDPDGRPTFHDLLPDTGARLYSAGRLDAASEGLLLVTNDGDLVQRMTHPGGGHDKTYRVDVDAALTIEQIRAMERGIPIRGAVHRAESVRPLGPVRGGARYEIVLRQGLNRQIRRMVETFGRRVRRLVRTRFGPVELLGLKPGEWRDLSPGERDALGLPPATSSAR